MGKPVQLNVPFDFARKRGGRRLRDINTQSRRSRIAGFAVVAVLWVGVITWRLFSLQIAGFEQWSKSALKQHLDEIQLASERGPILDRNGKLLAVSVPSGSVYARPGQLKGKDLGAIAKTLAAAIDVPESVVRSKLGEKRPFVWIKRQIPRVEARKVEEIKVPGIGYFLESRRFYPHNEAASTLIGRVGIDGTGLSGLELQYNELLHTDQVKTMVGRDALGNAIELGAEDTGDFELPRGEALQLTLDAAIQIIVDEELEAGRSSANALAAYAAMIDSNTGEVLALSQAPGINLNSDKVPAKGLLKNLLVESVFEPGSIMKPIVTAGAIDAGVVTASEIFNCESGRFPVGRHTIKDVHPVGLASVRDIVVRSSNIGMTKIGMKLGERRLYETLRRFGFGESTDLKLAGESAGILRPLSGWAQVDVATHSFGQGIAVTPLQIVRAVSAIANGGKLPRVHVVADETAINLKRIVSESTARTVKEMMFAVVEDSHGTGSRAMIPGVRVGGKTGTAQKPQLGGRGYRQGAYIASFVGFVDASDIGIADNLTLIVSIDEPHTSSIYGGTLAAPVFKRIMQRTLHLLSTRKELNSAPARSAAIQPVVYYQ